MVGKQEAKRHLIPKISPMNHMSPQIPLPVHEEALLNFVKQENLNVYNIIVL